MEVIMAKTALIQVRLEKELKDDLDALFYDLGFDTPTAIRMFLKQVAKRRGLPFEVSQFNPNPETIAAMEEANRLVHDPNAEKNTDVSLMFKEILADV